MRHGGDAKVKITWFGYPACRMEFGSAVMLIDSSLPRGAPSAAKRQFQSSMSKPGKPLSSSVGMPG